MTESEIATVVEQAERQLHLAQYAKASAAWSHVLAAQRLLQGLQKDLKAR